MIEHNIGPVRPDLGPDCQLVDIIIDDIDLVVNPQYHSFDSVIITTALKQLNITNYDMIDGGCFVDGIQYVTLACFDPEDVVKIRLLTQEIGDGAGPYALSSIQRK